MIIYSRYDFNRQAILSGLNNENYTGIVIDRYIKDRKLLTQEEYYKIENLKYDDTFYQNLMFSVTNRKEIVDNIFGIGTAKMCRILNNLSRTYEDAIVLKNLYNLEKLKMDGHLSGYFRKRKLRQVMDIFDNLIKSKKVRITENKHKVIQSSEYLIYYEDYIFCCHSNLPYDFFEKYDENHKWLYLYNISNMSKLLDLIDHKFGKYMK